VSFSDRSLGFALASWMLWQTLITSTSFLITSN